MIKHLVSDFDLEQHVINLDLIQKALKMINVKTHKTHKNRDAAIIVKRYFENRTYKEIADEYNVTPHVIRITEIRALDKLNYAMTKLMRV